MPLDKPLMLASASPRRRELLARLGVPFEIAVADVDETCLEQDPARRTEQIALRKGLAVAEAFPDRFVLSADTLVVAEGRFLGKPASREDAREMLRLLSGRWHAVYTGVCLIPPGPGSPALASCVTRVRVCPMTQAQVEGYLQTGEPMDKAGAYAVQGAGGAFVDRIEGSPSNVVGLPLALTRQMLEQAGIPVLSA